MPALLTVTVCLVDRYEGVRVALREGLHARGAARVVGDAAGVRAARVAPGDVLVVGPHLADGSPGDLVDDGRPIVSYTWLPGDERDGDPARSRAVVHLDLLDGIAAAVRAVASA